MKVQYLFSNYQGRDFVCGDIHGCFELLEQRLSELEFNPQKDRLFSVGDIIDRGAESALALDYLKKSWFYCVRGNHEQMFLNWVMDEYPISTYNSFCMHIYNGGDWVADYLNVSLKTLELDIENAVDLHEQYPSLQLWIDALNKLPYAIEIKTPTQTVGIVHAEIPQDIKWSSLEAELHKFETINSVLFSRKYINSLKFYKYTIEGIDAIYCGHSIVDHPKQTNNIHYIDTGAYASNHLTLIELKN